MHDIHSVANDSQVFTDSNCKKMPFRNGLHKQKQIK